MSFLDLPNETILQIAKEQEPRDLNSLLRTNRRLAVLLKTALIDRVCTLRLEQVCKGALYAAASRGDRPMVQRLIARSVLDFVGHGALLNDAVMSLDNQGLRMLIDCGIEPDTRDGEHQTPLSIACRHNRLDAVMLLIAEPRVNITSVDHKGRTALSFAAEYGHVGVVGVLLADPRVTPNI